MSIMTRLRLLWALIRNKQTPWVVRLLLVAGFAYILLPFDLIPDHLLIMGWMDDLALAIVLVATALKFTPEVLLTKLLDKIHREDGS